MQKKLLTKFNTIYDKKNLQKVGTVRTYLNMIQVTFDKPTKIILNSEKWNNFF